MIPRILSWPSSFFHRSLPPIHTAVVGVTGSAAVNETAIRRFKMPFYLQITVCTDVLKEGEDLHTFCDQVVHYGIAWTSGILEQRIGRVDRFFSQIERRLCQQRGAAGIKLGIYHPYLDDASKTANRSCPCPCAGR